MNNLSTYKSAKANSYLMNEIMNASPEKLLLKVYDYAIVNAEKKDMIKTNEAIQVLINALRYDNEEMSNISMRLFRLYQFCQDQMRKNNNEIVKKILTELRETWINAFNQNRN
ncbi:MAG: flagellar protein FliS [Ignavibacterium sp.]|nr:flagellar protein FliS [Ignavibacterium sp.]MCX7612417.1 flagellar protein FliS [Ignavibacterium sp.]MDW8375211.1 flagellar protein FliS [Ignavibacteriales bacterium]